MVPAAQAAHEERELELERNAIAGFIGVLVKERQVLSGTGMDALDALANDKLRRLDQLARHAERRDAWLRGAGHTLDARGMHAWLVSRASFPGIASSWARVVELAREAREQNELNGWLVTLQMQRTRRQLEFLNRMASNEPIYEADGVPRSAARQRLLGEA